MRILALVTTVIVNEFILYTPVPLGSIQELPAYSCGEIKASEGEEAVNGSYYLDLEMNGNPLKLHYDMTSDGGK